MSSFSVNSKGSFTLKLEESFVPVNGAAKEHYEQENRKTTG